MEWTRWNASETRRIADIDVKSGHMCGRYTLSNPQGSFSETPDIDARFLADFVEAGWLKPRFNIAPTQEVPIITNESVRHIEKMRWGLIPFWAKDVKIGNRMINARGETVASKPAFRHSFKTRRCLVPANGFYEWRKEGKARFPRHFRVKGGGLFAMAGLYDRWEDPSGNTISSFTIITTTANELLSPIHDRMPVILPEEAEAAWINLEVDSPEELTAFIRPFPASSMESNEVSTQVNSPRNDGPELLTPGSGQLF